MLRCTASETRIWSAWACAFDATDNLGGSDVVRSAPPQIDRRVLVQFASLSPTGHLLNCTLVLCFFENMGREEWLEVLQELEVVAKLNGLRARWERVIFLSKIN